MSRQIQVSIEERDCLSFDVDVLVLKYAQALYGVDQAVNDKLVAVGIEPHLPPPDGFVRLSSEGAIRANSVLFVGVVPLRQFDYAEIREFARTAMVALSGQEPLTRSVALTIHGPGYGLDEIEAFESELAGIVAAISSGDVPRELSTIAFLETNPGRAARLRLALARLLPNGSLSVDHGEIPPGADSRGRANLRSAGLSSGDKPHVFVAMPFAPDMDDVFHYGIQGAVNAAGLLCERADLSSFTGDVIDWVKARISSASLVVADMSTANPNVYLEVGYAWGCQVPTVLISRSVEDLKFDVRGQRCIPYTSIKSLESSLTNELCTLVANPAAIRLV
jgi:hypothetical protein